MLQQTICIGCSKKCILDIDKVDSNIIIQNNKCEKGIEYGLREFNSSKGILTTLVRVKGTKHVKVVPVKSSAPIDKRLWLECSKALGRLYTGAPVRIGDVICKNILNTGVDIIATKNIEKIVE